MKIGLNLSVANSLRVASSPIAPSSVDFLVIAGGGGGGSGAAGAIEGAGGGAGGYRTSVGTSGRNSSAESPLTVVAGTSYTVTVGAGGTSNAQGNNSVFSTVTSIGGGYGGGNAVRNPSSGGSGGGGNKNDFGGNGSGGAGTANQGFDGGTTGSGAAGGGGAGGAGVGSSSGAGGAGITSSITGTSVARGGGGGGSQNGAGSAGASSSNGGNGTANTGAGGHGGSNGGSQAGGTGGSGLVVLRYADTFADLSSIGAGLTYSKTTTGGYKIYQFTAGTGSVSW